MASTNWRVELFPRSDDLPTEEEVDEEAKERLGLLTEVQALLSNQCKDSTLLFPMDIGYLRDCYHNTHDEPPFRLHMITSTTEVRQQLRAARGWLVQIVSLQAHHLTKEHMTRLFRSAIEKAEDDWTDVERLYMALTDEDQGSAEERLDYAFALAVHFRWAISHARTLQRLHGHDRQKNWFTHKHRPETTQDEVGVCKHIFNKIQAGKLDHFACAIPAATINNFSCDADRACPICRNEFLDPTDPNIDDLISDYPVKIKYCGHIIGKSCLELWMDTPLANAAVHPHRTCPLCRQQIEFQEGRRYVPEFVQDHVDTSIDAIYLAGKLELDEEDSWDAILRLMSEEIVAEELLAELDRKMQNTGGEAKHFSEAKVVLNKKLKELEEERLMWGFDDPAEWAIGRKEWMDATIQV